MDWLVLDSGLMKSGYEAGRIEVHVGNIQIPSDVSRGRISDVIFIQMTHVLRLRDVHSETLGLYDADAFLQK